MQRSKDVQPQPLVRAGHHVRTDCDERRVPVLVVNQERRKRLSEAAQRALNEWYAQNGKQPWEWEHRDGVTPTTLTSETNREHGRR